MKQAMLAVLLLCSTTAFAGAKLADFKWSATVLRADSIPGSGVKLWVQIGDTMYYINERCLTHCHLLARGTVLPAKSSRYSLELWNADESKAMSYKIELVRR
jgi:hypothetical protein